MTWGIVKHFWTLDDAPESQSLYDSVTGERLYANGTGTFLEGAAPFTSRLGGQFRWGPDEFAPMGDDDFMVLTMARSVQEEGGIPEENGAISVYFGNSTDYQCRVQPYYGLLKGVSNAQNEMIATPFNQSLATRNIGQDYMFATVRRGDELAHWADGVKGATNDLSLLLDPASDPVSADLYNAFQNWQPRGSILSFGHAGLGDIGTVDEGTTVSGVVMDQPYMTVRPGSPNQVEQLSSFPNSPSGTPVDQAQDYYAILVISAPSGSFPTDQELADYMAYMRLQWLQGNKVVAPELRGVTGMSKFSEAQAAGPLLGSELFGCSQTPDGGTTWNDRSTTPAQLAGFVRGTNAITVGSIGDFATFAEAIASLTGAATSIKPFVETVTQNPQGSPNIAIGGTTPIDGTVFENGELKYVQVGADTIYQPMASINTASRSIRGFAGRKTAGASDVAYDLFTFARQEIILLPGTHLVDSAVVIPEHMDLVVTSDSGYSTILEVTTGGSITLQQNGAFVLNGVRVVCNNPAAANITTTGDSDAGLIFACQDAEIYTLRSDYAVKPVAIRPALLVGDFTINSQPIGTIEFGCQSVILGVNDISAQASIAVPVILFFGYGEYASSTVKDISIRSNSSRYNFRVENRLVLDDSINPTDNNLNWLIKCDATYDVGVAGRITAKLIGGDSLIDVSQNAVVSVFELTKTALSGNPFINDGSASLSFFSPPGVAVSTTVTSATSPLNIWYGKELAINVFVASTMSNTPTLQNDFLEPGAQIVIRNNREVGGQNVTFQDEGTLPGSGLRLSAATVALTPGDSMVLTKGIDGLLYQTTAVSNSL